MKLALGIALGALVAMFVACGSAGKYTAARETTPPVAAGPEQRAVSTGDARAQIDQLSADIERQRVEMQLPEPPAVQAMSSTPPAPPPARDPSCPKTPSDTCTSVCTLSDSICGNATRICNLATQLPGDDWAAGKCAQATSTCKTSQERCCTCNGV